MIKKYYKIIYYIFATLSIQPLLADLTQQEKAFLSAVHREDVELVQRALSAEVDPNVFDISQFPRTRALDIALQQKLINIKLVEQLLTFGADPDLLEDASIAALAHAVVFDNNFDLLDLLLHHNFDINKKFTPCYLTTSSRFIPVYRKNTAIRQGSILLTKALEITHNNFLYLREITQEQLTNMLEGIKCILDRGADFIGMSNQEIYGKSIYAHTGYNSLCHLLIQRGAPKPLVKPFLNFYAANNAKVGLFLLLHGIVAPTDQSPDALILMRNPWWNNPSNIDEHLYKLIITLTFGPIRDRCKEYLENPFQISDEEYLTGIIDSLKEHLVIMQEQKSRDLIVNNESFNSSSSNSYKSMLFKALIQQLIAQTPLQLTDEQKANLMLIANNYYLMHNSLLAFTDRAISDFGKTEPRGNIRAPRTTTTTTTITTASCATHNPKRSREDEDGNEGQGNPKRPRTEATAATLSLDPNVPRLEE